MSFGALGAAAASFAVLAAMFIPLERMFPARPGQPILRAARQAASFNQSWGREERSFPEEAGKPDRPSTIAAP